MRPLRVWQQQEVAIIPRPGETSRTGGTKRAQKPGQPVGLRHGRHLPGKLGPKRRGAFLQKLNCGRDAAKNAMKMGGGRRKKI